ncbi:DUF2271 domain-containing protein [Herbaspirillum sp. RTI4]|uniref:DUF2271 domain-containing protein n=1 Tax=Herbaspirillum sp. RTI4 TaxID=3048640 RepID=UPI002AB3E383|nr:DUF2271 domain-containing protein [Herbaspirillum sp. RTI4]MDY7576867.1 DUF2271 domain-containing protein [Herbaspirillum sp. RTI4]MEA9982526.1 DUF2271 domain-containing protein [Herbaspirillum sp. RTI4]
MRISIHCLLPLALTGMVTGAAASELNLKIDIPKINVAEYHRPYTAVWIEAADQTVPATLAVWYDVKHKDNGGEKWLKDLRQWWRRAGRDVHMPVDGVSGATRTVGEQQLSFNSVKGPLEKLPAGNYQLLVESARENGTHEIVKLPFQWPPKNAQSTTARGVLELGAVTLELKP